MLIIPIFNNFFSTSCPIFVEKGGAFHLSQPENMDKKPAWRGIKDKKMSEYRYGRH